MKGDEYSNTENWLTKMAEDDAAGREIWRAYFEVRRTNQVVRSGHGLCGCYPYRPPGVVQEADLRVPITETWKKVPRWRLDAIRPPEPKEATRAESEMREESVAEHSFSAAVLLYLLSVFYPSLFTMNPEVPLTTGYHVQRAKETAYRLMGLLLFHDAGEARADLGDQPDDGSQDKAQKDRLELEQLTLLTEGFPHGTAPGSEDARANLRGDFWQFQHPLQTKSSRNQAFLMRPQMVQIARVCDKADAVLGAIAYEKLGHGGDLLQKEQRGAKLTEQDRYSLEVTGGDSSTTATWVVPFARDYHMYRGFTEAMRVVKAGVVDVRGEWFPWWKDFAKELGISSCDW